MFVYKGWPPRLCNLLKYICSLTLLSLQKRRTSFIYSTAQAIKKRYSKARTAKKTPVKKQDHPQDSESLPDIHMSPRPVPPAPTALDNYISSVRAMQQRTRNVRNPKWDSHAKRLYQFINKQCCGGALPTGENTVLWTSSRQAGDCKYQKQWDPSERKSTLDKNRSHGLWDGQPSPKP